MGCTSISTNLCHWRPICCECCCVEPPCTCSALGPGDVSPAHTHAQHRTKNVLVTVLILINLKNGQNSTSSQISNPKFKIPIGCFLFEYEFWWGFCQDLYVFCTKTAFVMQNFRNLGASGGEGDFFFDKTPKRYILAWFHAIWDRSPTVLTSFTLRMLKCEAAADIQTKPTNMASKSLCRLLSFTFTIAVYYYSAWKLIFILTSNEGQVAHSA